MTGKQIKSKVVSYYKPILLSSAIAAGMGIFGWGVEKMFSANSKYVEQEVWKANIVNEINSGKSFDTLCSKDNAEVKGMMRDLINNVEEYTQETRNNAKNQALIDDLQNRQIKLISEKTKTDKEVEKLRKEQEELKRLLEEQTYIKKNKSRAIADTICPDMNKVPNDSVCAKTNPYLHLIKLAMPTNNYAILTQKLK